MNDSSDENTNESNQTDETVDNKSCFVAVHIGAGFHSVAKTPSYKTLCEKICSSVIQALNRGYSARKAVALAVALLENSPLTNAGLGSNLTLDEKIECDASIMDSNGFGAVGAVSNVKNPIMVSLSLLEAQLNGTLSMGRVVPCMLVGQGARIWAREHNITEVSDDFLKTENMIKSHQYYIKKLNILTSEQQNSKQSTTSQNENIKIENNIENENKLDTVGAVVLDSNGNFASAVSSGGILLKHPGRVGHASMFGCGCWVQESDEETQNDDSADKYSVAICTTGCGEYIIKTLFAKECAEHILKNKDETEYNLTAFYQKKFFNSPLLKNYSEKLIGAMVCKHDSFKSKDSSVKRSIDLIVSHSTPSMCFGYVASNMSKPISVMSRMDENKPKDTICINNFHIELTDNKTKVKSCDDTQNGKSKKQRLS